VLPLRDINATFLRLIGATTLTIYTVPKGKTFYLEGMNISLSMDATAPGGDAKYGGIGTFSSGQGIDWTFCLQPSSQIHETLVLARPRKLSEGVTLVYECTDYTGVRASGSIWGYEIDSLTTSQ